MHRPCHRGRRGRRCGRRARRRQRHLLLLAGRRRLQALRGRCKMSARDSPLRSVPPGLVPAPADCRFDSCLPEAAAPPFPSLLLLRKSAEGGIADCLAVQACSFVPKFKRAVLRLRSSKGSFGTAHPELLELHRSRHWFLCRCFFNWGVATRGERNACQARQGTPQGCASATYESVCSSCLGAVVVIACPR